MCQLQSNSLSLAASLAVLGLCALAAAPAAGQSITWTQRSGTAPAPRDKSAIVYDSSRAVNFLFGGGLGRGADGTAWEWSGAGGAGTRRPGSGRAPRFG